MFQKEAAAVVGIPLSTYRSWESGRRKPSKVCEVCAGKAIESYKEPQ